MKKTGRREAPGLRELVDLLPIVPAVPSGYFSDVLTVSNLPLSWVPTPLTAVMMAIAIPAAIRPYSMAVAPDSSLKNDKMRDFMAVEPRFGNSRNQGPPVPVSGTTDKNLRLF